MEIAGERRRHDRRDCSVNASLVQGAWLRRKTHPARVLNFSPAGARLILDADASLKDGERVRLDCRLPDELAGGPVSLTSMIVSRAGGRAGRTFGLRFPAHVHEQTDAASARISRRAAFVLAIILAMLMCFIKLRHLHSFWYSSLQHAYSLLACGFIVSRIVISSFYREPEDRGQRPSVSLIIAAMNEEDCITETVEACLRSRYPCDRLEIIIADDGSTDGTWSALEALRRRYPSLKLIRFPKNRGKRQAMAAGVEIARGDVLVFVDSDSCPDPEGLYRLVQPFSDPRVGAVAGHIVVMVEEDNLISKMESVRYYIGHRFIKAAESLFGAVTCCPGPFSAYRREALLEVLDGWLNQRFLGAPATFGDDRSLTLRVLENYHVIFHAGALCRTKVPKRWAVFFRQQLRWKKSWMRELPRACRLMLGEHPIAAVSYLASAAVTLLSPLMLFWSLIYLPVFQGTNPIFYILGFLMSYLCLSMVCFHQTGTRYWYFGPFFGAVYISVLVWQNYYAIFTLKRNGWGTR